MFSQLFYNVNYHTFCLDLTYTQIYFKECLYKHLSAHNIDPCVLMLLFHFYNYEKFSVRCLQSTISSEANPTLADLYYGLCFTPSTMKSPKLMKERLLEALHILHNTIHQFQFQYLLRLFWKV